MKKLTLSLAGILLLGATSLLADGSTINANKNVNLNIISKSKIINSTIGMKIDAKGSKVNASKNVNLNIINKSTIKDSVIGMNIKAR